MSVENYNELLSIKKRLPGNHIVEIANPKKYPELYKDELSFDVGHLSCEGANVFTEYVADEFKKNKLLVGYR